MKKIAILTSVLALAACGGGGGGGGGAVDSGGTQLPPLPPALIEQGNSTTTVKRNVNDTNYKVYKKLTSNTELIAAHNPFRDASTESAKYAKSLELVDEMGKTIRAWSQAAKDDPANGAKNYAQNHYEEAHQALQVWGATSAQLGDYNPGNYEKLADYFTDPANRLNNPDTLEISFINWSRRQGTQAKLATDFGQDFISSLKADKSSDTGNATLTFDDNGKLTEVHIIKGASTSRTYTVDENGQIKSFTESISTGGLSGKPLKSRPYTPDSSRVATFGNVVGLQYSDFGYLTHGQAKNVVGGTELADGWTFAGGYQIMKRDVQSSGEFKGVATAVIKNSHGDMMETATRDANVYVDPSSSETTLTANFTHAANPWYDVKLSNDDVRMYDNGANIPEQFRVKIAETSDIPDHDKKYLVTQAFGEGVDPTEMVATGAVTGMTSATDDGKKIDAHFSFGGKFEQ